VFFVVVVCLPAATLIALGLRLLDQDRALIRQRQVELLDRAADQAVRVLERDLSGRIQRLESESCRTDVVSRGAVCVVFEPDRIESYPAGSIPFYPAAQQLREVSAEPFQQLETYEFRNPIDLEKALDISSQLAGSRDEAMRAGALLREARILRKMGRTNDALQAFEKLSRIESVSINGEPAELVARRGRCGMFEAESRVEDLRREATLLEGDLHAGKWQLDKETFQHVEERIHAWLGTKPEHSKESLAFAAAVEWLVQKRTAGAAPSSGAYVLTAGDAAVTVLWSFGKKRDSAFIAAQQFVESQWLPKLQDIAQPARVYLAGFGDAAATDASKVQRSPSGGVVPWTVIVAAQGGQQESGEFRDRRRNLTAGLAALLILIGAGSYFAWRAVRRELAVARLQSDFVSAVSHEFRTPLTALRQFNELLRDGDGPTAEERRRFYQAQLRATDRLQRLVESLLDFGRMEAGRHPYQFKPLDAAALAQNVTEEFRCEVDARGFAIECSVDSGPHRVRADAEALSRALWNLLDNAVKYSGTSRSAEVQVSRVNGAVSIGVRDYGIGIVASEHEAIFQKFVRGAASAAGGIRGTGLGLAMVRHIVEAHGGAVNVRSVEGEGSTFTIVLPAKTEEQSS